MGAQYCQTLIAVPKAFIPSPAQVERFLSAMVALGVVPGAPTLVLWTASGKSREFKNPFTSEIIVIES